MATSTIKFYRGCKLTPDRNALLDNLEEYLATLYSTYSNDTFQYQKMDLDLMVKIQAAQSYQREGLGNYCKITQDLKNWYFFIVGTNWVSENVVEVQLSLDSINTFALESDYFISNKTQVIRKHKDRFIKATGTPTTGYTCINNIDKEPEGLSGINKTRDNANGKTRLGPTDTRLNRNWYLVYDNDVNDVIRCRLFPDEGTDILLNTVDSNWYTVNTTTESKFFTRDENGAIEADCDGTIKYISDWQDLFQYINVKFDGSKYTIYICNALGVLQTISNITSLKLRNVSVYHSNGQSYNGAKTLNFVLNLQATPITTVGKRYFRTINTVDRSDTKLISIICCPYCPIKIEWTGSGVSTSGLYDINETDSCLDLNFRNLDLEQSFTDNLTSIFSTSIDAFMSADTMKLSSRITNNETKLNNSEFLELKYAYGDNTTVILPENVINDNTMTSISADINYKQTNQTTADKVFTIDIKKNSTSDQYLHTADYDTVIYSNRQDNLPILNSNYLSYVRNGGYQYDKQAVKRQTTGAYIGAGLGIIQTVGGLLTAQTGVGIAMAVSGITTTISSISNAIINQAQLETSLQQKINEALNQSNSISNISSVDLINYVDGNKLYRYLYRPSSKQSTNIFKLFYNCGYAVNKQEEIDTDTTNTRYWFDYVQAEVVFDRYNKAYEKFTRDIKARYALGITRIHYHEINGVKYWGWQENDFENWEKAKFNI